MRVLDCALRGKIARGGRMAVRIAARGRVRLSVAMSAEHNPGPNPN